MFEHLRRIKKVLPLLSLGLIIFIVSCRQGSQKMTEARVETIPIEKGFFKINGNQLYYEVAGNGHPLVLVHGFSLDTRMWDKQFLKFAARYRVIRYDMHAFGKSSRPEKEFSETEDLHQLLKHLKISKTYIIGLSMGGRVAVDYTLAHPEMVDALIPVDAVISGFNISDDFKTPFIEIAEKAKEGKIEEALEMWQNHPLFVPTRRTRAVSLKLGRIVSGYSGYHWIKDGMNQGLKVPSIGRLSEIQIPTLIIVGEEDMKDFHDVGDILEKHIKGAKRINIKGGGHMINMEQPEAFSREVLNFLENL